VAEKKFCDIDPSNTDGNLYDVVLRAARELRQERQATNETEYARVLRERRRPFELMRAREAALRKKPE